MWYNNITETVGNTPLVRLNNITKGLNSTILAKLEFFNPGSSIKDRMAFYMLQEAEKRGELKSGGTIVEGTSGNTGTGLAIYAIINGYKMVFTIPDKMSERKINLLKSFGAKVIVCPTNVPHDSPDSYLEVAKRIVEETPNSYSPNQSHNKENPKAHYLTTGPEIWEQTQGKLDYMVIGAGTGGTISGVGQFLKEKNPNIKIIAVDPIGSIYYDYFYNYFKVGAVCDSSLLKSHVYQVEGIGEDMFCENMHFDVIDDIIQVSDKDAFLMARRLIKEEGIFAGGSSGAAVWATIELAKKLSKESIIATILPDSGCNYINKLYNDEWMQEKGFI